MRCRRTVSEETPPRVIGTMVLPEIDVAGDSTFLAGHSGFDIPLEALWSSMFAFHLSSGTVLVTLQTS